MHRPRDLGEAETGRQRLAFEELLVLQIGIARRAAERERTLAPALGEPGDLIHRYRKALPFALTPYQEQAIREIDGDLARTVPMQRLLQGDVGSGKTVVALYALLRAVESGRQGALMAPTETLAEQHFLTIADLCLELGVSCALLTSSSGKREREAALGADVVVGTHALIQEGFELRDLAVAVVDEQHRFGVEQRSALVAGRAPHVLHMTATPIPRTLALTVYGDLAVSEIAKPPASRKPVITSWITEDRASEAYTRLTRLLREGRQAYVVCPLIEASETSLARAAEEEAERLRRAELREFRVGCLHGRLKAAERRDLMARFKARELDVLVATTVIEVGVDVAERDGDDRAGGRPLRARAAAPAPRPRRSRGRAVVLRARLPREGGADGVRARAAAGARARRATASSSRRSTSSCAAAAPCSARGSRASPTSASPISSATASCSSGRGPSHRKSGPARCRTPPPRSSPRSSPRRSHEAIRRLLGAAGGPGCAPVDSRAAAADLPRDASPGRRAAPRRLDERVEQGRELSRALEHRRVARVEFERLDAENVPGEMPLPLRADDGVPRADDVDRPFDALWRNVVGRLTAEPGGQGARARPGSAAHGPRRRGRDSTSGRARPGRARRRTR